jgi:hypothetical protein
MAQTKSKTRIRIISILLFVGCLIVYLLNARLMISGDSVPTSLWMFNLLENHTINFNSLADQPLFPKDGFYYFQRHVNGDWITFYPMGTAILTAPLYLLFYIQFKLTHFGAPLNLLTPEFAIQSRSYERLAASILASSSVVIFFHLAKARFKANIALISAILFAFATTTWTTSSQALWQHGAMNFSVLAGLLALVKANQSTDQGARDLSEKPIARSTRHSKVLLILAGILFGLLPGIRPTAVVYMLPPLIYVMLTQWRGLRCFGIGLLSALPALAWNFYYFGHVFGGYSTISGFHKLEYFFGSTAGILFSPSRGLFVYSPILLFVLPGFLYLIHHVRKGLTRSIDHLFLGTFLVSNIILGSYFFVLCWWGGFSYGPRFLTDILPACCLMLAYCLEWMQKIPGKPYGKSILQMLFALAAAFSVLVQFVGVAMPLGGADWNGTPYSVDIAPERAWQWTDNQIMRHFRALQHEKLMQPIKKRQDIINQFAAKITSLNDESGQPVELTQPLKPHPNPIADYSYFILRPQLQNIGSQTWYGYKYGIDILGVYVKGKLFDRQDKLLQEIYFYAPDRYQPQELAETIGTINLPNSSPTDQPYKLVLEAWLRHEKMLATGTYLFNIGTISPGQANGVTGS